MKKSFIFGATALVIVAVFFSCSKKFLELQPSGQFLESNYYQTPDQAFAGLVAAYDPLVTEAGGIDNTYSNPLGALNSASDECFAGGGGATDQNTWQVWNNYTLTPAVGPQGEFWAINFTGVNRCNTILDKLPGTKGLSSELLKRYTAEAKFLRAHYYFDLERLFKNIPLIVEVLKSADVYKQAQANPADVYAQIENDLSEAIPDLPTTVPADENGRVTQGAAIALLGKVYLYEQKWTDAATQLAKVNGPTPGGVTPVYGYKLMDNFGDIFSPDHKFNSESIFELAHTPSQNYGWGDWPNFKGNVYTQMIGPRNYNGPTYWAGWGFNPITPELVAAMQGDPREPYTIVNIDSLAQATGSTYEHGYDNTGYFIRKFAPLLQYKSTTGTAELNFPNNYIEIRLADTYLMEAEALVNAGGDQARAQALLDAVRARVGLSSVAVSLDNIYHERRLELATEGHRWFDLVRTGRAASVLAFKGFVAGKNELLPIPLKELNNTLLQQNPNY
jgi:hypothetical protein